MQKDQLHVMLMFALLGKFQEISNDSDAVAARVPLEKQQSFL